jgi:BirA family transcriptional regulator, biotin operon repressor / biotin---[acetyl-CoA-carboxylase] ligase
MFGFDDRLTLEGLQAALSGHPFVREVAYYSRVGSSNDVAKACAGAGAHEGLLVVADEQTAGRGRMQRDWWAPSGAALLTSVLFRPPLLAEQAQQLAMLCALAAADAVTECTGLSVALKWPNDLLLRERKLAGVLAETAFKGDCLDFVVVGVGINVNMDFVDAPEFITPATSLRLALGHPVARLGLLLVYLDGVAQRYAQLKAGHSPYKEWSARLVTLGRMVRARRMDGVLEGVAEGVAPDGALLLRTADGVCRRLLAADISLRGGHPVQDV